jgi:hypothetical protein
VSRFGFGLLLLCVTATATATAATRVEVDEQEIILGRTESTVVHFFVEEDEGAQDRPLQVSVNVGKFGDITREGRGHYRAVYVPPATRFPQVALVAVWRETGPDAGIDFFRIPLNGVTRLPVTTRPRSKVTVGVGTAKFGPVDADGKGEAVVTLVVPPGVVEAAVSAVDKLGSETRGNTAINVPPYNRLTAALVPHAVVADGHSPARLHVFYDLGGADLPPERIQVAASEGRAVFEFAKEGRYVYRYLPLAGSAEKQIRFGISVQADPASSASAHLSIGLPAATRLLLRPPAQPMPADGRSTAEVQLLVFDESGLGLPGQSLTLTANGEPLSEVRELGGGSYVATLRAPKRYPPGGLLQLAAAVGEVRAVANYQLKAAPVPAHVSARFSPEPVPADGRTRAEVVLDLRDAAGLPLEGAELLVSATGGALSEVEPIGNGRYRAAYVAEKDALTTRPELRIAEPTGVFLRALPVPVRADPGRLLIGVRAGVNHTLTELVTARIGLDAFAPLRLGDAWMNVSLSATFSRVSQRHQSNGLTTRSDATLIPVTLRLGVELFVSGPFALSAGVGPQLSYVHFQTSLTGAEEATVNVGANGGLMLNARVGPGVAFAELGYAYAPVEGQLFRLDAGGIGAAAGYRFGVW